jgi:hypothetical protein
LTLVLDAQPNLCLSLRPPNGTSSGVKRMRGTGRVFQRSKSAMWWFAYYHQGREHRESSGSTDRKAALRGLKERLREVGAAELGLRPFMGPA